MTLMDVIEVTLKVIKTVSETAVTIYNLDGVHRELRDVVNHTSIILNTVADILNRWEKLACRVNIDDELYLINNINRVKALIITIKDVLQQIQEDRNAIRRLTMKTNEYKQRLLTSVNDLTEVHRLIDSATSHMTLIEVYRRELQHFRRLFPENYPDKEISIFNFSIIENTSSRVSKIALREFDPKKHTCYMKVYRERLFISYHRRTWEVTKPMATILHERRIKFQKNWNERNSINNGLMTDSLPLEIPVIDINDRKLRFSEFSLSSDHVCGLAFTQSIAYIATKHEIKVIQLMTYTTIAQYEGDEDGYRAFKHISYIYIPSHDETSLYIVDCDQCLVHQYRIDDSGFCFQYIRQYVVIANVNQKSNLVSCVIYNNNLYVSDNGNNCLHVFSLKGERQLCYLIDSAMNPFSPGSLCVDRDYLYVANCSTENSSILVFNEECELKDCFRHQSLREILAFDIDSKIKELFILTTTMIDDENNETRKRPLVVSMDLLLHSSNLSNNQK